jgi:hypothetical protein
MNKLSRILIGSFYGFLGVVSYVYMMSPKVPLNTIWDFVVFAALSFGAFSLIHKAYDVFKGR